MNYSIEIVTEPTFEPVDQADVRRHLKASSQDDNLTIELIIRTAREYVEQKSGRVFAATEFKMYLDSWGTSEMPWWDGVRDGAISEYGAGSLEIPRGPLISVTHIKTYDAAGTATTWASTEYDVDLRKQDLGRIKPKLGYSWPTFSRAMNGIEIQFVAGYDEAKNVPALPKLAIMMQCAHLYQNRGDLIEGGIVEAPRGVLDLINQFKVKRLGL